MAENNDARLEIEVVGVGNEQSGEQSVKDIQKGINKASDKGRIKVPVDITVPIDNTKTKLTKAQKDITSELSKMMTKGFSASGKDIDVLVSKFDKFTKALDAAGKGRQNKIYREIRKQVEDLQKSYKALKSEMSTTPTKVSKSSDKKAPKKTATDRYLDKQEEYSRRSQGAGKRAELKRELDYVRENKSPIKSGSIRPSATNEQLMRLSEYSAYGSNWASELSRIMKEEIAKSAKTLVTYIDPIYAKKTKGGRATTEQEFLSATFKDVREQLKKSVAQLELGSEDITLDLLKEQVAVMKVLGKELGKTTEQIERSISSAIQSRYSSSETKQLGGTSLEAGQIKGVGPGHENTQKILKELYNVMKQWDSEVVADNIAKEMLLSNEKAVKTIEKGRKKVTGSQTEKKVTDIKLSDDYKKELQKLNSASDKTFGEIRKSTTATEKQANIDKIENVREAVSDSNVEKTDKENKDINRDTARAVKNDATTGFNTDSSADELIGLVRSILSILQSTLGVKKPNLPELPEGKESVKSLGKIFKDAIKSGLSPEQAQQKIADISNERKRKKKQQEGPITNGPEPPRVLTGETDKKQPEPYENKVQKSNIYASPFRQGFWAKLEGAFESLTGATKGYEEVLRANAEEQDKMAAERIKTWGMNNGRNPNDTGDIASMRRILQLYRTNKNSIEQNPELMQKIKLTPGIDIDTTEVTKAMNEALSGKRMEKAQNGGGFWKNAFGFMTGGLGYAFMPSLEKSRAQADGLNQMFGNINKALQSVLTNIQTKETELAGMEKLGQAKFDKNGYLTPDSSSAAFKTLADLEEEKWVLDSIRADLAANDEIIKRTGGRFPQMVKYLKFTSPVLKENNTILRNINSGLDKNGKALKFQNRLAEILNYTYQLMSRHIGQMIKNWITMANPINLIKKAFSDFGSYDVKWQRTMNVIKINFQRIIKPAMEWIAQKLVNIIGFFDIVSQRIQAAFGKIPISLFDQAGAESEQIRRNLEEAANVSLGFDELHDVGTDQSGANDLMGDIYKPQLSQDWIDMATKLGDTLGGFFKGDLGFGDVCKVILELLGKLLASIGKAIWGWFKETALGKWITEHWKGLLATLLTLFVGWQLLKIFGPTLLSTIGGAFKTLIGKVGGWLTTTLGSTKVGTAMLSFGSGMVEALKGALTGKAGFLTTMKSIFVGHDAITAFSAWGETLGGLFVQALGIALGGAAVAKGFDMVADDASYNMGLMESGGKKEDQKSGTGGKVLGAIGGAAIGAFLVGGPLAIGIGAIAGLIVTSLAPAFEELAVKAKDANNEMQKIEYYEGQVQGATTQVNIFDEQLNLLKQSLDLNTQSVYDQGEKLGISKTRMDELVKATQDGTFTTDMLTGSEQGLAGSLTDLAQKQEHVTEVSKKLEEAQKKLLKAQTDLSIAQDVEAGNFELAAARIEVAEAQGVYATEEATAKRIQLYKQGGDEERKNLLQNLTPEQRTLMAQYNGVTDKETKELVKIWQESGSDIREAFLSGTDESVQREFQNNMNSMDNIIKQHQSFWQKAGDTIAEIFSFGNATTWTYNAEAKYEEEKKKGKFSFQKMATGTNYVESDGLVYLHQGEAVIPKKYNQPYQPGGMSVEERAYMDRMIATMNRLDGTIAQGINVKGEFRQRGNDLVATVEKNKSRQSNTVLNNKVYAR